MEKTRRGFLKSALSAASLAHLSAFGGTRSDECKLSVLIRVWADFLEQQGISAWSELPAWVPSRGDYAGFGLISVDRGTAHGLSHRGLTVTARDTLEWWESLPYDRRPKMQAGLSRQREREVLTGRHEYEQTG